MSTWSSRVVVLHGDVPEDGVVEGSGPARWGIFWRMTYGSPASTRAWASSGLRARQGSVAAVEVAGVLLRLGLFAEAVVGVALFHQQPGVLSIGVPALGLDIGGHRAAHVGALVVVQAALRQGAVDDLCGALHLPALVGVLDAQDKGALPRAGR